MKNILILGAGIYQVPLIRKAKEMGLRVLVCTIPGDYPGIPLADKAFFIDTTDKEGCSAIARQNNVAAVCTCGTDVALPTLGYIVDSLGLKGPSEKASLYSSNKLLMKESLVYGGVSTAEYRKATTLREALSGANAIGYPCVLKVVDSSGSRGIQIVYDDQTLCQAYPDVISFTKKDYVIIEKFLSGEEFGAQAFVYDGMVRLVMPHSDEVYHGATGVPIGHSVPLEGHLSALYPVIHAESVKAIQALGIDNAAVNIDFILVGDTPYVLEVGARCGATGLAELVSLYYGIDYYEILLKASLGCLDASIFETLTPQCAATAMLITSDRSGFIKSFSEPLSIPNTHSFSMDYGVGEYIRQFKTGPDRIGQVIVSGRTVSEARSLAKSVVANINLEIEVNNNNKQTDMSNTKQTQIEGG